MSSYEAAVDVMPRLLSLQQRKAPLLARVYCLPNLRGSHSDFLSLVCTSLLLPRHWRWKDLERSGVRDFQEIFVMCHG